jgi:hypothetical protein
MDGNGRGVPETSILSSEHLPVVRSFKWDNRRICNKGSLNCPSPSTRHISNMIFWPARAEDPYTYPHVYTGCACQKVFSCTSHSYISPILQAEVLVGLPRAPQRIHLKVAGYVQTAFMCLLMSEKLRLRDELVWWSCRG